MNLSFYNAAVGMQQQQLRMDIQANNISNVNTHGFKAQQVSFSQLMYRNLMGIDQEEIPRGAGTRVDKSITDFSPMNVAETGRKLDFAIIGDGFFALYDPVNGEISFTRDGSFTMASFEVPNENAQEGEPQTKMEYRLSDGDGRCVLDVRGNFIRMEHPEAVSSEIGVFDYAVMDGMLHANGSRFLPQDKNGDLYWGTGEVRQGVLETSNVDLAHEMVKVIEAQRAYSYALRMVQTSDEIETTINGLRG